jgi:hypothetical protein
MNRPVIHITKSNRIELAIIALITLALAVVLARADFGHQYEADFIQNVWMGGHMVLHGADPYYAILQPLGLCFLYVWQSTNPKCLHADAGI